MENVNKTQVDEKVNEETTSDETGKETEVKTFTQEELDRIVADRIARERKKLDKFADYDDLKAKAAEYERQLEEKRLAELSEKERVEEIAKKAQEEKSELELKLAEYQAQVEREKITNAFITAATSANIAYIDDALRLADLSTVKVEDGKVIGIESVVEALVQNKPFLVKQAQVQPKTIGEPTNTQQDEVKTIEQQLDEAKAKKDVSKVIELSNKLKGFIGK